MKRYDERILGKLLDKYERSVLYSGKNQINCLVSLSIEKRFLPEYFDESAMQFDVIHEQLEQLESEGYIRLFWKNNKKGHILEKCQLVTESVPEAYRFLKRKPKSKKEEDILKISKAYFGKAKELDQFLLWIQQRIHSQESIAKYVDINEAEEFERLCQLISGILANQSERFLRQFSIEKFHDSKIAEKDVERAARIIAAFSEDEKIKELESSEILEEYNIYKNPSWLMIKGNAVFRKKLGSQEAEVDLRLFPGGIGLSNQDIDQIYWMPEAKLETVVTIENLTSFHQWEAKEGAAVLGIYLGGYHNQAKRIFLQRLYEAYPDTRYFHFGDMDCGGFKIWKDLCIKTGIPFQTLFMDLNTYEAYWKWGRELTVRDRKTLTAMMEDPFFQDQIGLFLEILEKGMKVEQECVKPAI